LPPLEISGLHNLTPTSTDLTWIESPDATGRTITIYLSDIVTVFNATITNLSPGFCSISGLSPGTTYYALLNVDTPSGVFGTGILIQNSSLRCKMERV
jgi:hypothetical protein